MTSVTVFSVITIIVLLLAMLFLYFVLCDFLNEANTLHRVNKFGYSLFRSNKGRIADPESDSPKEVYANMARNYVQESTFGVQIK